MYQAECYPCEPKLESPPCHFLGRLGAQSNEFDGMSLSMCKDPHNDKTGSDNLPKLWHRTKGMRSILVVEQL